MLKAGRPSLPCSPFDCLNPGKSLRKRARMGAWGIRRTNLNSSGGLAPAAASFADLDELIWNPISTAVIARTHPSSTNSCSTRTRGDGASALPTAELVGIGGLVDAVDTSAERSSRSRASAASGCPSELHVADPTTWETTGYDLVQCVLGVASFPDLDAGTRAPHRAGRPGGRVAIACGRPAPSSRCVSC